MINKNELPKNWEWVKLKDIWAIVFRWNAFNKRKLLLGRRNILDNFLLKIYRGYNEEYISKRSQINIREDFERLYARIIRKEGDIVFIRVTIDWTKYSNEFNTESTFQIIVQF